MTGCLRDSKAKSSSKIECRVELCVCHDLPANTDEIIDVACRIIITTVTVKMTRAGHTGIERSREWRNSRTIQPNHRSDNSLGSKSSSPVSKTESSVQENLPPPPDCEVNGGDRVQQKPTIPPGKVDLPDEDALPGVPLSSPLNETDNGL